jgi:uncharacterized protein YecE (DUF72 family)
MAKRVRAQARERAPQTVPDHPDETEDKREKFERIALARMNRALNAVRLIGNLASYNYDWTEADVELMRQKLDEVADQTFARFQRHKRGEKPTFTFTTEKQEA